MKIISYVGVGPIAFGSRESRITDVLGEPIRISTSRRGLREVRYKEACYRFDAGALIEVTVDAAVIELGESSVSFVDLPSYIQRNDPAAFESLGFFVSPLLGIALDPQFPSWVTAFSRGLLPVWPGFQRAEPQPMLQADGPASGGPAA